jgi:putative membrane protein
MLTTAVLTELAAHPGYGWGGGGGFGWLFLLIPLFWIIVVIALFAIFGRRWRRGWNGPYPYGHGPYGQGQADSRGAEKTLAERFAQGDIDEVEYRARLEVLRANRPAEPPAR